MRGFSAPPRQGGKVGRCFSTGDIVHRDLKPGNVRGGENGAAIDPRQRKAVAE